jgi:copper resistance protein D
MDEVIVNFLHLLATAVWIGGAIFIQLILNPSLFLIEPQQSGKLQGIIAKRFSITAWSCLIILIITGIIKTPSNMYFNTASDMGLYLTIKHGLIILMIILGLAIGLIIGPRMRASAPKQGEKPSGEFLKHSKQLHRVAMLNTLLGILVLVYASMLW